MSNTHIVAVREVSKSWLEDANFNALSFIKDELYDDLAKALLEAINDGKPYVVQFLGWQEENLMNELRQTIRYSAAYSVCLYEEKRQKEEKNSNE